MTGHEFAGHLRRPSINDWDKQRMLNIILASRQPSDMERKLRRKGFALVLAASVFIVVTTTACLAVGLGWHKTLIKYLNPSPKVMEGLSDSINTPEASVTVNGLTVNVLHTLVDSYYAYVLYEVILPDDVDLTKKDPGHFEGKASWDRSFMMLPFESGVGFAGGGGHGEPLEQSGNRLVMLNYAETTEPLTSGTIRLECNDLQIYVFDEETGYYDYDTVWEGEISLEWEFTFKDATKTIELDTPLGISGGDEITKIVISPLSVNVFLRGRDNDGYTSMVFAPVVKFSDGSEYNSASYGYGSCGDNIDEATMTYGKQIYFRFDKLVDVDDVVSVTVGNTIVPID